MTDCPTRNQLAGLLDHANQCEETTHFQTHVAGCASCQQVLAELQHNNSVTQSLTADCSTETMTTVPVPEGLRQHPRYRISGLLGRGGMGAVFKGEHRLLERPVVVKVIRPDLVVTPQAAQRFQREAKLAARLSHPNVVTVYEAEELGSTQFLVMEYIEGVNFAELVAERGLLPLAEVCELIRQAANGLAYIHTQGMVHRDIKPQNLLVSRTGQVKILDLGLATLKSATLDDGERTAERQFLGTVDYSAPEQWECSRDVDIRADIYSLGCTFYYLLVGQAPFPSSKYSTLMQQMWAHSQAPLPPIREVRPDIPEPIAAILTKMLAKLRDDRYSQPSEIATALTPYTQDCNLAEFVATVRRTTTSKMDLSRVSSGFTTARPPVARRRMQAWGIGAALFAVGLIVGGAFFAMQSQRMNPSPSTPDTPEATKTKVLSGPPIKVGVLHSRTGTMAISEAPVIDATLFAIEEINQQGGLLGGRPVEPLFEDGESNALAFATKATKLIAEDKVTTLFGCWTSASRKTVLPIVQQYDHLLVYPLQYEGMEQATNIIYTGAAPNQQIIPAVKWCVASLEKKRFFLVGSDYVFPRAANAIIKGEAKNLGVEVVGEAYVPFADSDVNVIIQQIRATKPDVILNTLNGDSNIAFFRALRGAGITTQQIPTVSFSISEVELSSLNVKDLVGDYAAWNYFQSVNRAKNLAFVERFQARYGKQRAISDPMESAYVGVHLWAQAVAAAGTTNVAAIRKQFRTQSYDAPSGLVTVDSDTQHVSKTFRIGRITEQGRLQEVFSSENPINPVPYPNTRTKGEWDAFLLDLKLQWGGQWANPGKKQP